MTIRRALAAVAAGSVLAATATACTLTESDHDRVTRRAIAGVRAEVTRVQTEIQGILRKPRHVSPKTAMKDIEHGFGRRESPISGGLGIFRMEALPDRTINTDLVLMAKSSDSGFNAAQAAAAACVRFSGKPSPDATVTLTDVPCPAGVEATNVTIVKVKATKVP